MKSIKHSESTQAQLNPERNPILESSDRFEGKKRDQKSALKKFDFCSVNSGFHKLRLLLSSEESVSDQNENIAGWSNLRELLKRASES
jgi:hypothetical protein